MEGNALLLAITEELLGVSVENYVDISFLHLQLNCQARHAEVLFLGVVLVLIACALGFTSKVGSSLTLVHRRYNQFFKINFLH